MGWPGPMTARQWRLWLWWLDDEWERPNRSDNYLIAVRQEVRNLGKGGGLPNGGVIKFVRRQAVTAAKPAPGPGEEGYRRGRPRPATKADIDASRKSPTRSAFGRALARQGRNRGRIARR